MKQYLSFMLSIIMLSMFSIPAWATDISPNTTHGINENVTLEMLIEAGYTQNDAENLLEFDRVLDKMKSFNQSIEYMDGQWIITDSPLDNLNHITDNEYDLLVQMLTPYIVQSNSDNITLTREEAYKQLNEEIQKDPSAISHTIDMGNGRFLKCSRNINDDEPITTRAGGTATGASYLFVSYKTKSISYTLEESADGYYARVVIKAIADCRPDGMYLTHVSGTQASVGIISIQNAGYSTQDSPATSIGSWCDARNDVVFAISGSVSCNLSGVISLSLNVGANWTQSAILRAWKTEPYGHVIEFAEVYTI